MKSQINYKLCNLSNYPMFLKDLKKHAFIEVVLSKRDPAFARRIANTAYADYMDYEDKQTYVSIEFDGFAPGEDSRNARFRLVSKENSSLLHLLKPF